MVTGKEVHTQKIDFLRLFGKKVVSDVSRWAWHRRNRVINREKPIVLKLAQYCKESVSGYSLHHAGADEELQALRLLSHGAFLPGGCGSPAEFMIRKIIL